MCQRSRDTSIASFTVHKKHHESTSNLKSLYKKNMRNCYKELCSPQHSSIKYMNALWMGWCWSNWSKTPHKPGTNIHQRKLPWNCPLRPACWDRVKVLWMTNLHLFGNKHQIVPFIFYSLVDAQTQGLLSIQWFTDEVTSSSGQDLLPLGDIFQQLIKLFYL